MPLKVTVCVPALSVTVREPEVVPVTVGVKVTLRAQARPGPTLEPQLLVWAKPGLTPMLEMVRAPVPVLDRSTVNAALVVFTCWEAKVRLEGVTPATGAVPVPVSAATEGPLTELSLRLSEPIRVPVAVGVKSTLKVQLDPPGRLPLQVLVSPKSPEVVMPLNSSGAPPILVRVKVCGALDVPTF